MAGRPKQKVYHYDNNGRFIKEFASESDVRKEYYSHINGKKPLFVSYGGNPPNRVKYEKNYLVLPDNTFLTKKRIGREGIRKIKKRLNNPFINPSFQIIELINVDKEIIATFQGIDIASKLTGISKSTIYTQCNDNVGITHSEYGLIFRYKTD